MDVTPHLSTLAPLPEGTMDGVQEYMNVHLGVVQKRHQYMYLPGLPELGRQSKLQNCPRADGLLSTKVGEKWQGCGINSKYAEYSEICPTPPGIPPKV